MKRNWRRTLGQHLRRMTQEQILALLVRIRVQSPDRDVTVGKLTGGIASKSINKYVAGRLRERLEALRAIPRLRPFDPTEQHD